MVNTPPPPQISQGTILIADDDPTSRHMLRHLLEDDGFVVEEVEDGIATLQVFETLRPDLILLDALMPKKDGFEVCKALQKMPGGDRTPVLMITGLDDEKMTLEPVKRKVRGVLDEVRSGFEWMASNYQVKLEIGECSEELSFTLDWTLMLRVLSNLASNAIKHSPASSVVILSAVSKDDPDGGLRISVTDQGEGISEQDQKRIFEKFTQASGRKRGSRTDTGLGLTFCKLATEAHGGRIELTRANGRGSTFPLDSTKPLGAEPAVAMETAPTQSQAPADQVGRAVV